MSAFLTLTTVAIPFVITPGASFTLTFAHAIRQQAGSWLRITVGTGAGILLLALGIGATGLGAVLDTTPLLRTALGLVGTAVLLAFGTVMLIHALRPVHTPTAESRPPNLVRWSFAAVVTNPKALSLYALVVPTLATPRLDGLSLFASFAAIHIGLLTAWLFLVHQAAAQIPAVAGSPRTQRGILVAASVAMIVLGLVTGVRTVLG